MLDNFPFTLANAFNSETEVYSLENRRSVEDLLKNGWIILGIASLMVVWIGLFLIRPSINKIFRELDLVCP